MEKQKAFTIYGKVRELESMIGVPGLKVEALDKDIISDDRLGSVTKDIDGNFEIRYGANRTEEFVINLPKKLLKGGKSMKEKIEDSRELRGRILRDKELLRDLSEKIAEILNGKVEIGEDETYAFVPLVYKKPIFAPEIFTSVVSIEMIPFGGAGPLDPEFAVVLEKYRVRDDEPLPVGKSLREQILSNKALLNELSEGISKVLMKHGVAFENDETYAFMPVVFKKPVFGHELFTSSHVFDPHPDPWITSGIRAFSDASPVMLGPQPEPPDSPTLIARVSTIAQIEKYGILPQPFPGPLDPWLLNVLEESRIQK